MVILHHFRMVIHLSLFTETQAHSDITSERTYTDPHRWARFKWYARFVQKLNVMQVHTDHQNKRLIQTLVAHNGGESIFPSLRCLWWPVFPFSDTSFFPLLTSRIRSVVFDFHRSDFWGKELEGDIFLAELRASSPRLCQLSILASKQRVGMNHSRIIASFEHITELHLFAHISLASFLKVAAMPFLESLQVDYIHSEELEPVHPRHRIYAPCLTVLFISANCSSLTQIATTLDAPNLATARVEEYYESTCRDQSVDYMTLIAALATLGSPSTMEDLHVALYEGDDPPVLEHLANLIAPFLVFTNLTRFSLSCPSVLLVGDQDDFLAAARAWPKLRVFQLIDASWATRVDPDDENSEPTPIPTPQVLECFRDQFPVLEELMLPYLDFYADVPARRVQRGDSCHGLARLAVGPKNDWGDNDGDEDGEPDGEREDRRATEWARYILDLFPNLDVDKVHHAYYQSEYWLKVFERMRPISQQHD